MNLERLRKAPNISIVGSSSPLGKELKEMLEGCAFPIGKLSLLETEEYVGLLQEFAGDIGITQIISPERFAEVDIAFFACSPEIMNSYALSGNPFPELTIDLTQTRREGQLFLSGISDSSQLKSTGYFINPHPATIALTRVLSQIHEAFQIEIASITVLEPASEKGLAGVDELQEQTVSLLNFQQVQSKTFGGQLAFNLLMEPQTSKQTEELVIHQIVRLLGATLPLPAIATVQAPVFHSHSFSMFLKLAGSPTVEQIEERLRDSHGTITVHRDTGKAVSPITIVGSDSVHVGRMFADPNQPDVYFLWLVADNLRIAASNAIQIAESIMLAPAPQR